MNRNALSVLGVVAIAGVCSGLGLYLWASSVIYKVHSSSPEIVILHSKRDMFIFLEKRKAALSGRRGELIVAELAQDSHRVRELEVGLEVAHLSAGGIRKYSILGMSIAGGPVVVDGVLYWRRGGDQVRMWRWSGTSFSELEPEAVRSIRAKYSSQADQLKREGWEEIRHSFNNAGSKDIAVTIEGLPIHVSCTTKDLGNAARQILVAVHGDSGGSLHEVLMDLSTSVRPATAEEIEAIGRLKNQ